MHKQKYFWLTSLFILFFLTNCARTPITESVTETPIETKVSPVPTPQEGYIRFPLEPLEPEEVFPPDYEPVSTNIHILIDRSHSTEGLCGPGKEIRGPLVELLLSTLSAFKKQDQNNEKDEPEINIEILSFPEGGTKDENIIWKSPSLSEMDFNDIESIRNDIENINSKGGLGFSKVITSIDVPEDAEKTIVLLISDGKFGQPNTIDDKTYKQEKGADEEKEDIVRFLSEDIGDRNENDFYLRLLQLPCEADLSDEDKCFWGSDLNIDCKDLVNIVSGNDAQEFIVSGNNVQEFMEYLLKDFNGFDHLLPFEFEEANEVTATSGEENGVLTNGWGWLEDVSDLPTWQTPGNTQHIDLRLVALDEKNWTDIEFSLKNQDASLTVDGKFSPSLAAIGKVPSGRFIPLDQCISHSWVLELNQHELDLSLFWFDITKPKFELGGLDLPEFIQDENGNLKIDYHQMLSISSFVTQSREQDPDKFGECYTTRVLIYDSEIPEPNDEDNLLLREEQDEALGETMYWEISQFIEVDRGPISANVRIEVRETTESANGIQGLVNGYALEGTIEIHFKPILAEDKIGIRCHKITQSCTTPGDWWILEIPFKYLDQRFHSTYSESTDDLVKAIYLVSNRLPAQITSANTPTSENGCHQPYNVLSTDEKSQEILTQIQASLPMAESFIEIEELGDTYDPIDIYDPIEMETTIEIYIPHENTWHENCGYRSLYLVWENPSWGPVYCTSIGNNFKCEQEDIE